MSLLTTGTRVKLKIATHPDGTPVQGVITGYTNLKAKYIVDISGPHVAYYVTGINNLSVSEIMVHEDNIEVVS